MNIQELAKKADAVHDDVVVTPFLRRFADLVLEEVADMVNACDRRATPKGIAAAIRALKGAKE